METNNIIKLNSLSFPMVNYNRYTNVEDGKVTSHASVSFKKGIVAEDLESLLLTEITTIQIWNDSEMIYEITNKHGKITNISESYSDGSGVSIYANISF